VNMMIVMVPLMLLCEVGYVLVTLAARSRPATE
jgi:Sec-independent protein secretion pathway component TatC